MPSSSKKKKNEEKITQLKQELLEQQKQVLKARQKISSRKETYLALKTASEIDSDYFKSVLVRRNPLQITHNILTREP
jgi:precorrin-2 methylase